MKLTHLQHLQACKAHLDNCKLVDFSTPLTSNVINGYVAQNDVGCTLGEFSAAMRTHLVNRQSYT